jgi:hypothetical protein
MSVLSDFLSEVAAELDKRAKRSSSPPLSPELWKDVVRFLTAIDRDGSAGAADIRSRMERIVQRDERFQDRARALLPILLTLLPPGSLQ